MLPQTLSCFLFVQLPWADVRKEMVEDKGLSADAADKIGKYVQLCGGTELLDVLSNDSELTAIDDAKKAIEEMRLLFQYCETMGAMNKVKLNMHFCGTTIMITVFFARSNLTSVLLEDLTTTLVSSLKLC